MAWVIQASKKLKQYVKDDDSTNYGKLSEAKIFETEEEAKADIAKDSVTSRWEIAVEVEVETVKKIKIKKN